MQTNFHKAFTMIELVFVIVVIGILSAVAIPKLALTRDDAVITNTKTTIASVRSSTSTERQKRILRGDFTPIISLNSDGGNNVFSLFSADKDANTGNVLEYPVTNCTDLGKTQGCWSVSGAAPSQTYTYTLPASGGTVDFNITSNRFNCKTPSSANCKLLTR